MHSGLFGNIGNIGSLGGWMDGWMDGGTALMCVFGCMVYSVISQQGKYKYNYMASMWIDA